MHMTDISRAEQRQKDRDGGWKMSAEQKKAYTMSTPDATVVVSCHAAPLASGVDKVLQ